MAISESVRKTAGLGWKQALLAGVGVPVVLPAIGAIAAYYPAGAPLLKFVNSTPSAFDSATLRVALVMSVGVPFIGSVIALAWGSGRALRLSAIFLAGIIVGVVPGFVLRTELEMQAYALVAPRSAILVSAIESYEKTHGAPPEQLTDLVPSQIPEIPSTGIRNSPMYMYSRWHGPCRSSSKWRLWIPLENSELYRRWIFYCPQQDYDLRPIESDFRYTKFSPVGNWVYASTDLDD